MNSLFKTYLKLYPGKADVIQNAIFEAVLEGEHDGLSETEIQHLAEQYIIADL